MNHENFAADQAETDELEQLVAAYRDGIATAEQAAALDRLIATSPRAAEMLCEAAWQEVLLGELFQTAEASDVLQSALSGWTEALQPNAPTVDSRRVARAARTAWEVSFDWISSISGVSALISGLFITSVLLVLALLTVPQILPDDPSRDPITGVSTQVVARITGTTEARWSEASQQALAGDVFIFQQQPLDLHRGLVEIRYDNGVVAVVEGPARFQLDTADSMTLGEGQVLARVPPAGQGFVMHLPGAKIVDHGTEFGVQVGVDGSGDVHIFEGLVEAQLGSSSAAANRFMLTAGDSLSWLSGGGEPTRSHGEPPKFAHRLPRQVGLRLPNTGRAPDGGLLPLGAPDPAWQVGVGEQPDSVQQAVVVGNVAYSRSDTNNSQWISLPENSHLAAGDQVFTFSTRFTLSGVELATVRAAARCSADNAIVAVRLNGHEVSVPPRDVEQELFKGQLAVAFRDYFVDGENELQVDVHNSGPEANPMALRWEWIGRAVQSTDRSL